MKKKRFVTVILFGIILLGSLYLLLSRFSIRNIIVEGVNAQVTVDDRTFPNNLLLFPSAAVEKELSSYYPQFQTVAVSKRYPSTLILHFIPRIPVARLMSNSRSVALDSSGVVLGDSADTSLPVLYLPVSEMHIGKPVSGKGIVTSLAFLSVMGQDGDIETVTIGTENSLVVKMAEMIILLEQNSDGSKIAHTLQGLMSGFRIRGTRPKIVDLRFEKSVVTF